MRSRVTHVEFPVFAHYVVHVEVTSDLRKSMERYPPSKAALTEVDDTKGCCCVHVVDEPMSLVFIMYNSSVGDVAHESWHAVRRMMEYVGVELDSETVAYHLGYLVDQIFRFLRRR